MHIITIDNVNYEPNKYKRYDPSILRESIEYLLQKAEMIA